MFKAPSRAIRQISLRSLRRSNLNAHRNLLTLAIETTCDDTAVAILSKHGADAKDADIPPLPGSCLATLHFNEKITANNSSHRGIHPVETLNSHQLNLALLIERSLDFLPPQTRQSEPHITVNGSRRKRPDFISVTRGPGMRSNIGVGLDTAKGLSLAWQIPLLAVHHMQAHALTPRLESAMKQKVDPQRYKKSSAKALPTFPFQTLLVSGGHTILLHSAGLTDHAILATTVDIAVGDALDKCGRLLLPPQLMSTINDTSFAKHLSHFAFPDPSCYQSWLLPLARADEHRKPPTKFGWDLQIPLSMNRDLSFSFSGLASAVDRIYNERQTTLAGGMTDEERLLLARMTLSVAFEHLASKTIIALEDESRPGTDLVVSGGVAANPFLRHVLRMKLDARGFGHIKLVFPSVKLCTDNAAMIAWCGMEMYEAGWRSQLSVKPLRRWSLDPAFGLALTGEHTAMKGDDGNAGILNVPGWERPHLAIT